uniref:Uncharacterized protein n=1 Tax=Oryza punctata TaxID=4537 RepID=A0A0E0K276_ORYPU
MLRAPKRVVFVSFGAAVLGLLAAILGFVAEGAKSKASSLHFGLTSRSVLVCTRSFVGFDGRYRVYRATPALGCEIAAAVFLLSGQAAVTAASGCFGRWRARRREESAPTPDEQRRRSVAVKLSVVSWVLVAAAVAMFLYGASRNAAVRRGLAAAALGRRGRRRGRGLNVYGCAVLGSGLFSAASVASLAASACGIAAYVYVEGNGESSTPPPPQPGGFAGARGVAMVVSRISSRRWRTRPRATPPTLLQLLPHHRTSAAAAAPAMSPNRVKAQLEIAKRMRRGKIAREVAKNSAFELVSFNADLLLACVEFHWVVLTSKLCMLH